MTLTEAMQQCMEQDARVLAEDTPSFEQCH